MIYHFKDKSPVVGNNVFIAPSSQIIGEVELGDNSSVWFNTVIRGDDKKITVGSGTNIQDGTVVHGHGDFNVQIGNNVTVGHGVILHGCHVGDGSLIGMGSILLNGVDVGKNCLIAAGSLVPEGMKIPDASVVMGHPAKVIKNLSKNLQAYLLHASEHYVAVKEFYKEININGKRS